MRPLRKLGWRWIGGGLALALLAWQGHHLAHDLPAVERRIATLGPWGPVALVVAILLLGPLLVPDSIFGVAAGVCFGLSVGTAWYFVGVYVMCLAVQAVSSRWLRAPVLARLASRPALAAAVAAAAQGGARLTFLLRLLPVNQALLSYALGAAGVPVRFALLGNLAMLVHMFPTVYFGAAAAHMTRMAGQGHRHWEARGVALLAGLVVCALLTIVVTRRALKVLRAAQVARVAGARSPQEPPAR